MLDWRFWECEGFSLKKEKYNKNNFVHVTFEALLLSLKKKCILLAAIFTASSTLLHLSVRHLRVASKSVTAVALVLHKEAILT